VTLLVVTYLPLDQDRFWKRILFL